MTLPIPQAEDLLDRCEAYRGGDLTLAALRDAVGETAAAAEGELREKLASAKESLSSIEDESDSERQEAEPVVDEVEEALRGYLEAVG